jgi:hypothetical protein
MLDPSGRIRRLTCTSVETISTLLKSSAERLRRVPLPLLGVVAFAGGIGRYAAGLLSMFSFLERQPEDFCGSVRNCWRDSWIKSAGNSPDEFRLLSEIGDGPSTNLSTTFRAG